MSEPRLDWSQAEVTNGKLTVAIAGEPPPGWKDTFQTTALLLSNGEWEDVKLKKHTVRVHGLRPGAEEKLRFFLEGVVQQANATHEPKDEEEGEDDGAQNESEESASSEDQSDDADSADAEMTERFRSFAKS